MNKSYAQKNRETDHELTRQIIGAAIEVHRVLGGPGLVERVYESALCHEFSLRNIHFQRQLPVPIHYKGAIMRDPLYLDLLVENQVILEVKATEQDMPVHQAQLLTYLRLTGMRFGLLVNFGKRYMKEGIYRLINN